MTKQKQLWPEGHQCFVSDNLAFNGKFLCFQLEKLPFFHGWKFWRNLYFAWCKRVPWERIGLSTGDTILAPPLPLVWLSHVVSLSMHAQKPPMCVDQASHLRVSGGHQFQENKVKLELSTAWNNMTTLLNQGKKIPSVCSLIICRDENSLLLSYSKTLL